MFGIFNTLSHRVNLNDARHHFESCICHMVEFGRLNVIEYLDGKTLQSPQKKIQIILYMVYSREPKQILALETIPQTCIIGTNNHSIVTRYYSRPDLSQRVSRMWVSTEPSFDAVIMIRLLQMTGWSIRCTYGVPDADVLLYPKTTRSLITWTISGTAVIRSALPSKHERISNDDNADNDAGLINTILILSLRRSLCVDDAPWMMRACVSLCVCAHVPERCAYVCTCHCACVRACAKHQQWWWNFVWFVDGWRKAFLCAPGQRKRTRSNDGFLRCLTSY